MLILGVAFLKKGQDLGGARWFGKLATVVFYIMVIILLGAPSLSNTAVIIMILTMSGFLLLSFVLYVREYYRMWNNRKKEGQS